MTPRKPHKFDNLIAQFVYQGRFMEENVAIKHLWQKGNGVFFDLYFYRTQTTKIIDSSYIRTLYDLSTDKSYTNMKKFVEEYFDNIEQAKDVAEEYELESQEDSITTKKTFNFTSDLFEDIKEELIMLYFLSGCSNHYEDVKINSIIDFVAKRHKGYDDEYIKAYIDSLDISEDSFYNALEKMTKKPHTNFADLLKEAMRVTIADGGLNYCERIYLSEIIQTFREHEVKFDVSL